MEGKLAIQEHCTGWEAITSHVNSDQLHIESRISMCFSSMRVHVIVQLYQTM